MADTKKVAIFELAPELGLKPLDLVKQLKDSGVKLSSDIKNHMSEVSSSDAEKIREYFLNKDKAPKQEEKKTTVKKKAAGAEKAEPKTPAKKTTAVKTAVKKKKEEPEKEEEKIKEEAKPKIKVRKKEIPAPVIEEAPKAEEPKPVEEHKEPVVEQRAEAPLKEEPQHRTSAPVQGPLEPRRDKPRMVETQRPSYPPRQGGAPRPSGDRRPTGPRPTGPRPGGDRRPAGAGDRRPGQGPRFSQSTPVTPPAASHHRIYDKKKDTHVEDDKKKAKGGVKRETKLEVVDILEVKTQTTARAQYGLKKKPQAGKEQKKTLITVPKASKRKVRMEGDSITVSDLAKEMSVKAAEVVKKLMTMGTMATMNQKLDIETATLLATEFSYEIEQAKFDEKDILKTGEDSDTDLVPRSPVVTMMGHVDHGKTSILDAIRKTNVADKEAGGITQRIGAYEVQLEKGSITFIDTPGHEAFTEMRARGSQVTDIVVLVVAADDGVMPQTKESIDHARAAGVEIVVALNKIDKPNANPDMVKKQLAELDLLPEDWGGQTIVVPTAAKKGEGIKQLLEAILLQAEIMELKANPDRSAEGVVIEARLDKGMGPVATVIVQKGTLKVGDSLIAGTSFGRIRSIKDPRGNSIDSVKPGHAGEIHGLDSVPMAGEKFNCLATEYDAKKLVEHRLDELRKQICPDVKKSVTLDDIMKGICTGETKELKLVVKADTQGSVEALKASLENLTDEVVAVKVILSNTGGVTSNDVNLALASGAVIIAFNVRPDSKALEEAQRCKVDIRNYDVIYSCLEDIEKVKLCMLEPTEVEKVNGQAEVRQVFNVSKIGTIAGCGVKSGKIIRNSMVRVIREGTIVYTGKLKSLKRFKDDAKEVAAGLECGMSIDGFNDIKQGDILESYSVNMVDSSGVVVGTKKAATPSQQS